MEDLRYHIPHWLGLAPHPPLMPMRAGPICLQNVYWQRTRRNTSVLAARMD